MMQALGEEIVEWFDEIEIEEISQGDSANQGETSNIILMILTYELKENGLKFTTSNMLYVFYGLYLKLFLSFVF